MKKSRYIKALFISFAIAQLISIFGDRLNQFSVVGMVGLAKPGSSGELLKLALFTHVPILLFAPLFGSLIDRWRKSLIMILSDLFRGFLVLLLPTLFLASKSLYAFYFPIALLSLANLLFAPAKSAIIPEFVDKADLLNANAILWGIGIVSSIMGFILGGYLFDYKSWQWSFYIDGLSYLSSALLLVPLIFFLEDNRRNKQPGNPRDQRGNKRSLSPLAGFILSIKDCTLILKEKRIVGEALLIQTLFFGLAGVLYVIGIAHIQEISSPGRTIFLSMAAASGTFGLLLGSIFSTKTRNFTERHVIAISAIVIGTSMIGIAKSQTILSLSIWALMLGTASSPIIIITETLLQKYIPEKFRGRIFSAREVLTKSIFLALAIISATLNSLFSKKAILVALGLFLALTGMLLERKGYLRADEGLEKGSNHENHRKDA